MNVPKLIEKHIADRQDYFLDKLKTLLRIPSLSADPAYKDSIEAAARSVLDTLASAGVETELIETGGPPLVYGESPPVEGRPVVLVYGHYDVQPADPLELWETPPFEPTVRNGNIYARGATDDKGQMLTHLFSALAYKECDQPLPVQLKFLIEGQEEVGSSELEKFLARPEAKEKLGCDVIVISDSTQFADGQPAITYGLRGIAYFEVLIRGPKVDLHSGSFGGVVRNPAVELSRLVGKLIDENGKIQLPGFYESVGQLHGQERAAWRGLPFNEEQFARDLGVESLHGEEGYTTLERRWARPTCDVHGLWSGYQGEGAKTVLPAVAGAKLSFRLVPDQQPEDVAKQLGQFLEENVPSGVEYELKDLHGGLGVVADIESSYMEAAKRAVEAGFGKPPVLIREGGSIPIVAKMVELLDADVLLLGWGLSDDGAHSPNEKFRIADFYSGIQASAHLWRELAEPSA